MSSHNLNTLNDLYSLLSTKDHSVDIYTISKVIHYILPKKTIIETDGILAISEVVQNKLINKVINCNLPKKITIEINRILAISKAIQNKLIDNLISLFYLKRKKDIIKLFFIYVILTIAITSIIMIILSYETNIYKYNQDRCFIAIGIALMSMILLLSISFILKVKFLSNKNYEIFFKLDKQFSLSTIKYLNEHLNKFSKKKDDLIKICIEYIKKTKEEIKEDNINDSSISSIIKETIIEEKENFKLLIEETNLLFNNIKDKLVQVTLERMPILTSEEAEKIEEDIKLLNEFRIKVGMFQILLQMLKLQSKVKVPDFELNINIMPSSQYLSALYEIVNNSQLENEYRENIDKLTDKQREQLIEKIKLLINIIKNVNDTSILSNIFNIIINYDTIKKNEALIKELDEIYKLLIIKDTFDQKKFNFISINILIKLLNIQLSENDLNFFEEASELHKKQVNKDITNILEETDEETENTYKLLMLELITNINLLHHNAKLGIKRTLKDLIKNKESLTVIFNNLISTIKTTIDNNKLKKYEKLWRLRNMIVDQLNKIKKEIKVMPQSDSINRQDILIKIEETISYTKKEYRSSEEIAEENTKIIEKLTTLIDGTNDENSEQAIEINSLSRELYARNADQNDTTEDDLKKLQSMTAKLAEKHKVIYDLLLLTNNNTEKIQLNPSTVNVLREKINNLTTKLIKSHQKALHVLNELKDIFNAKKHVMIKYTLPKIIYLQELLLEMKNINHNIEKFIFSFDEISNPESKQMIDELNNFNTKNKEYYNEINNELLRIIPSKYLNVFRHDTPKYRNIIEDIISKCPNEFRDQSSKQTIIDNISSKVSSTLKSSSVKNFFSNFKYKISATSLKDFFSATSKIKVS